MTIRSPRPDAGPARRRILRWNSAIVLVVGLVITSGLAAGSRASIDNSERRYLQSQLRQAETALRTSIASIQDPLIAAVGLGSSLGPETFRRYVAPLVGADDPFTSVSLWEVRHGSAMLLAAVGAPPRLPPGGGSFAGYLARVHTSSRLGIAGMVVGPRRAVAVVERDPGSPGRVVYAESAVETPQALRAAGSPLSGMHVVAYLGTARGPEEVLEETSPAPIRGSIAVGVVMFGSARVTVVAGIDGDVPGSLPPWLPLVFLVTGLGLTVIGTVETERIVRRRERAERLALDRGRRYETERGVSEYLQHAMRPADELEHAGVELAARYVPGTSELEVGGDWYDTVSLDDGSLFLAIGDVSGHGLKAATVVPSLRHAVRAYAMQGDAPSVVLRKLNGLVDVERDHCLATVLCAKLDVRARRVTIGLAGHPPPLIVSEGEARFATVKVGTPIGVAESIVPESTSYDLPEGSSMVLYTDGLIERRQRSLDEGMERLRSVAARSGGSIREMVDRIVGELRPERGADDVAILGVRLALATVAPGTDRGPGDRHDVRDAGRDCQRFPPTSSSPAAVRRFVGSRLDGVSTPDVETTLLLVSELASNVVVHARTEFQVRVRTAGTPPHVRVEVTDTGPGAPVRGDAVLTAARGRGLQLVDSLAAGWGVEWTPDRSSKTVWFTV